MIIPHIFFSLDLSLLKIYIINSFMCSAILSLSSRLPLVPSHLPALENAPECGSLQDIFFWTNIHWTNKEKETQNS